MDDGADDFPGHGRGECPSCSDAVREPVAQGVDVVQVSVAAQDAVVLVDGFAGDGALQKGQHRGAVRQQLPPDLMNIGQ
jgi:hypothetical protein